MGARDSSLRSASLLAVLALLAGCFAPEPPDPAVPPDPLQIAPGWSYAHPNGSLRFEGGLLHAALEADQLALELDIREPLDLRGMTWTSEGQIPPELDRTYPWLFSLWKATEPWPRWTDGGLFLDEIAGVETSALGVSHHESHPQWLVVDLIGDANGSYAWDFEIVEPIELEPGTWRIWLAFPLSTHMELQIALPEVRLAAPPEFAPGCGRVKPGDFESELMVYLSLVAAFTHEARWAIDLPEEATLYGSVFRLPAVVASVDVRFHLPTGETWRYERYPLDGGWHTDPEDWPAGRLASTVSGSHVLQIAQQAEIGATTAYTVLYCVL